jgi:hypothetical protein
MGWLMSPEFVKDWQRSKGMAGGVTSVGKDGMPEGLAVILPGDSAFIGIGIRTMFISPGAKLVDTVEGVGIYRFDTDPFGPGGLPFGGPATRPAKKKEPFPPPRFERKDEFKEEFKKDEKKFEFRNEKKDIDKKSNEEAVCCEDQPDGKQEPPSAVVALLPDAFLIGTPGAVKDAIRRAKKKAEGPSLAKSEMFQEMRKKVGVAPGLFAYVNMTDVHGVPKEMAMLPGMEWVETMNKMVNPKAFRAYALNIGMQKGTIHYHEVLLLNPKEKSELLELLPAKAVNTELLHYAPKDAVIAMAMANDNGQKRWERLLAMIDAFVPPPEKGKAAEHIKQMEQVLGVNIAKDIAGKITNVAFAVGDPFLAPMEEVRTVGPGFSMTNRQPKVPMLLILEAADEDAAKVLMDLIPKIGSLVAQNKKLEEKMLDIKGQTVISLRMDPTYSVHYARAGKVILIGPYGAPIAQALANGADKKGLLSDEKLADRLNAKEGTQVSLFLVKPVTGIAALVLTVGTASGMSMKSEAPKAFPIEQPKKEFKDEFKKPPFPSDPPKREFKDDIKKAPDLPRRGKDIEAPKGELQLQTDQFTLRRGEKVVVTTRNAGKDEGQKEPPRGGKNGPPQSKTEVKLIKDDPETARIKKEFRKILNKEGWFLLSVTRGDGYIRSDGQGPGLQQVIPKLVNFAIEESYRAQARAMKERDRAIEEERKFEEKRREERKFEEKRGEERKFEEKRREERKRFEDRKEENKEFREEKKAVPEKLDKVGALQNWQRLDTCVLATVTAWRDGAA